MSTIMKNYKQNKNFGRKIMFNIPCDIFEKILKDREAIANGTAKFVGKNGPFITTNPYDYKRIDDICNQFKTSSKMTEKLMNTKYSLPLFIWDDKNVNNEFYGAYFFYTKIMVYTEKAFYEEKENPLFNNKYRFKSLTHEFIHHLQCLNIESLLGKLPERITGLNNIQTFYIQLVMEADACTKSELIFGDEVSTFMGKPIPPTKNMNELFLTLLRILSRKFYSFLGLAYTKQYDFEEFDMTPTYSHNTFKNIINYILSSGTEVNGGIFPHYDISFSDISKILDESIVENKKLEMLESILDGQYCVSKSVISKFFDESIAESEKLRMAKLIVCDDSKYSKYGKICRKIAKCSSEEEQKDLINAFCMSTGNKKMRNLLNYLDNTR